ncbi:fasciculation and elongation protein zeta-2 [Trichonephila inaurata madagascariensis]|uniref:Fasciculation and elongation protein zeta-2 n=1 Tax=Trichonephila inaurata madagascariensis TaxID=2747483 RepID=A0A8X6MD69_9ARAC|nr:fasciculation and elongation protein zeta-2 [Trichonephila inaurata madagascariensis]
MRDWKMAELSVEAPLAMTEDWSDFSDFQSSEDIENSNKNDLPKNENDNGLSNNFNETFSTSLEDLVNTFDDKITKCFCNYEEKVEKFAPVQIRTQDEIMNECQMWWTLTGNFGNMLPIDWSKSYTRKMQINCLNLNEKMDRESGDELDVSDDEVAKDLDLHSLIISSLQQEPMFTAEQVLEEIDEIMQQDEIPIDESPDETDAEIEQKENNPISSILYEEKLKTLTNSQLNEVYLELERMIQENSEVLIQELALRDELEFEKELKNTFISYLLTIQNKKRQHSTEKRRGRSSTGNNTENKFLTTVIPYSIENGPPNNQTLQILIKILKAINEDNPAVPTLLTDYILKVLCPT